MNKLFFFFDETSLKEVKIQALASSLTPTLCPWTISEQTATFGSTVIHFFFIRIAPRSRPRVWTRAPLVDFGAPSDRKSLDRNPLGASCDPFLLPHLIGSPVLRNSGDRRCEKRVMVDLIDKCRLNLRIELIFFFASFWPFGGGEEEDLNS